MGGRSTHPRLSATRRGQRRMGGGHPVGESRMPATPRIRSAKIDAILSNEQRRGKIARAISNHIGRNSGLNRMGVFIRDGNESPWGRDRNSRQGKRNGRLVSSSSP